MEALYKSSGLSSAIPAASYSEQSTRRILPVIRRRQIGVFPLSLVLFYFYPERIIHETLNEQQSTISIGDWLVCTLRFADGIDMMGATNCKTCQTHWVQVPAHTAWWSTQNGPRSLRTTKTKSVPTLPRIVSNWKKVSKLNFVVTLSKDGTCKPEICIGIATATAVMAQLGRVLRSSIGFPAKHRLFTSLVLSTMLYGCEA